MIEGGERGDRTHCWPIPWGLLGMVGLILAIETTLARHDLDFTAVWHWDWRVSGRDATRPAVVHDKKLLFFGDSLIKFTLVPRVIGEATGASSHNFGLQSGQASSSYFLLRRTLRAGAKPSAIVLDLTPHMLMHSPEENKALWAELLSPEECLDFAITRRDAEFFLRTLLQKALPSYRERFEIRSSLLAALDGKSASKRWQIPIYRRNWKVNDGAQVMGVLGNPPIDPGGLVAGLYSKWEPDPVNVIYLERFLQLAADHQIPVYWLLTPFHPDVQALTVDNLFDLNYSNFVQRIRSRFPGTFVIDARRSNASPELYLDGIHLNRIGALKLSVAVADVIRERAERKASDGWVYIDALGGRDYNVPIEDVDQSGVAIEAESKRIRR